MPKQQVEMDIPLENIWLFISDMDNWAPLVPGYRGHEKKSERQSIWKLHGEVGKMQKTVHFTVNILEWKEPNIIRFNMSGLNNICIGEGSFEATELTKAKTGIILHLHFKVKGKMGAMFNPILKKVVPRVEKQFTKDVTTKITETEMLKAKEKIQA